MLPFQPESELLFSLSGSDLSVIILNEKSTNISVPSKTYNLLAVGSPLLCITSPESELAELVRKYNNGKTFEASDIEGIVQFILEMNQDKEILQQYSKNSLKASSDFTVKNAETYLKEYLQP